MAGEKMSVNFEVNPDSVEMLNTITEQYRLPNSSKTLRCLLDYIAESEEDWGLAFKKLDVVGASCLFASPVPRLEQLVKSTQ